MPAFPLSRLAGALCLAFAAQPLVLLAADEVNPAPPSPDEPVTLDTVIVEASPLGGSADELVQPVSVLAGKELERRRRGTIGEMLESQPGVSTSDFGAGVGRPIIRGQAGPRVSVLENGIGSMDVSTLSTDHAVSIDPANAEQVEILRGPATLIYGNGASGGVVNIVDNRLPEEMTLGFSGKADTHYASNGDERNGRLDLNYGVDDWLLHGDYAGRKAGNFEIPGNAFRDGSAPEDGIIPNSALTTQSGGASLSHLDEDGSLGLAVSRYEDRYGIPKEEQAYIDLGQTRIDGQGLWKLPLPGWESFKLRAGHNDYSHTEYEAPGVAGTRFNNEESEARVEAVHAPLGGWRGVLGSQLIHRDFEAIGEEAFVPPTRTRSVGAFVVEQRSFGPTVVELGARYEYQQQEPDATGLDTVDQQPVSLAVGAIYALSPIYHLRLNLTRAQRAPAAEELYAYGPHLATGSFERGNSGLDLETANNLEIGLDRHQGRWTWQASVYYNRIERYVYLSEADDNGDGVADQVDASGAPYVPGGAAEGPLLLVDYRQDAARFWGYEFETAYQLLRGPSKLRLRLFTDAVHAGLEEGGDLPRIAPARWGLSADGSRGAGSASLELTRVLTQDEVAALEAETPGYTLLSADLGWRLRETDSYRASLYLRGRNLLDEEARRHTSFLKDYAPLPGASGIVGLDLKFF